MNNQISKWADEAMFRSESHNAAVGPKVSLIEMSADPLGEIAACAKMYKGEVVRSLSEVTHDERQYYLREVQKTKLKMPMEAVHFHFMIENVTRAFTHQLVRQRTGAYAQESMRFAVVEDMNRAVSLPPSLAMFNEPMPNGDTKGDWLWEQYEYHGEDGMPRDEHERKEFRDRATKPERQYLRWRETVDQISSAYNDLVNDGMPAEDARGLMPTNIITRVHYITNLRNLVEHAGNRLCTQAQFEWRLVFAQITQAIREYEPHNAIVTSARKNLEDIDLHLLGYLDASDRWQYEEVAKLLKPACYLAGHCVFDSDMDRKCSIRTRVQANADVNRPSNEWDEPFAASQFGDGDYSDIANERGDGVLHDRETHRPVWIGEIRPQEWLADPNAARKGGK